MTKIKQIKFENVGLLNGQYDINGKSVIVSAENGSGKSTFIEAFKRVCEKSMPEDIIAKGVDFASCQITLTDGTLIDWSQSDGKKPAIKLLYADGNKVTNPAKDILSAFNAGGFDVNEFARLTPKAKKEAIAKMSGIDLDKFEQAEKTAEENRRVLKRQLATEQARVQGIDLTLSDAQLVDVAELQESLSLAESTKSLQERQVEALVNLRQQQADVADEVNRLNERLKELKKKNGQLIQDIQRGQSAVEMHVDNSGQIADLKQQIASASETNTAILKARQQAETVQQVQSLRNEVESAEKAVADVRNRRVEAVKNAQLPAGLIIDETGQQLYFTDKNGNSINIESANKAQETIISLQVAFHNIGSVKMLAVDLSHLDKKNRQYVIDWANSNDLQLFAERAVDEGLLTVEFI